MLSLQNILSSESKSKNQNMNIINSLQKNENTAPFSEISQKKARAVSTAPHQFKINFAKDKDNKITITKNKEMNSNINLGTNNGNISSSIYNSAGLLKVFSLFPTFAVFKKLCVYSFSSLIIFSLPLSNLRIIYLMIIILKPAFFNLVFLLFALLE